MGRIKSEVDIDGNSAAQFIKRLPEDFDSIGATIFQGRNTLKECEIEGRRIVAKRYRRDGFIKKTINRFRHGKAYKSHRNALRLIAMGIETPRPVGYLEIYNSLGFRTEQYYVCEYSDAAPIEDEVVKGHDFDREFITALARFFAELHEKGILHKDSNNTNIRYERRDGKLTFSLIDINRMEFGAMSRNECLRNLTHFSEDTEAFDYFLDRYIEARGWSKDTKLSAKEIKWEVDSGYARKQRLKRLFKRRR